MRNLISNINKQDYATRRRWLFGLVSTASLIVLVIWVLILHGIRAAQTEVVTAVAPEAGQASSWEAFKSKVDATWDTFKDEMSGAAVEFKELASTTPTTANPAQQQ